MPAGTLFAAGQGVSQRVTEWSRLLSDVGVVEDSKWLKLGRNARAHQSSGAAAAVCYSDIAAT